MRQKSNYDRDELTKMIEALPGTTTRPMFGYQCYSVEGKFFAGFGKKNNLIIRLSSDLQAKALRERRLKIKPFSHGAKMGWVEIDGKSVFDNATVFEWIKNGYQHAQLISRSSSSKTRSTALQSSRKKFDPSDP